MFSLELTIKSRLAMEFLHQSLDRRHLRSHLVFPDPQQY
jgi:hypothetical protein